MTSSPPQPHWLHNVKVKLTVALDAGEEVRGSGATRGREREGPP